MFDLFVIFMMLMCFRSKPLFAVYKTELAQKMGLVSGNIYAQTVTKLTMTLFGVSYHQQFNVYGDTHFEMEDILIKCMYIARHAKGIKLPKFKILIVDEYTVLNPELVLCFCLFAMYRGIHVLFVGDRCQQNSIAQSKFHARVSNYYLLRELSTSPIFELIEHMRCKDIQFNTKLTSYRNLIREGTGHTPLNPYILFHLYQLFKFNFYCKVDIGASYLAAYHRQLKARVDEIIKTVNAPNVISPYFINGQPIVSKSDKFSNVLLLIIGADYIYVRRNDKTIPYGRVKLVKILTDGSISIYHYGEYIRIYKFYLIFYFF